MSEATAMDSNHSVELAAKIATYGGGAGALFFGLTASEFAAIAGVAIAAAGLVVQVIYTVRRDRREEKAMNNRLNRLEGRE